jgi:hypothetical protein
MENIAAPITKEEAQAEFKRAADAAFAEYLRVEASGGVEHKRVIADARAKT